jgi:hypothetical protein
MSVPAGADRNLFVALRANFPMLRHEHKGLF